MSIPGMLAALVVVVELLAMGMFIALVVVIASVGAVVMSTYCGHDGFGMYEYAKLRTVVFCGQNWKLDLRAQL